MSSARDKVRLVVNGVEFGGWKSVRIGGGIERQAASFELEVTDKWPGQIDIPRRIVPFDTCTVHIGDDLVLSGHVDATPVSYDGKSVRVGVKGRSKTADLVDCCPIQSISDSSESWADVKSNNAPAGSVVSAPPAATQWRDMKMEKIASALARPYGVRVVAEVDTGAAIPDHQIQQGETVFESIDRMMRLRHVLSTDNEQGDLVFIDVGSAGRATTMLELGKNVLTSSSPLDYTGVFSDYVVKGQRAGNDLDYGDNVSEEEGSASETASAGSSTATDARSKRKRVLVIKQQGQADSGTCQDRAEYERAHRAAKALQTVYTVAGWRQEDGTLWRKNLLVRVRDALVGFDMEMVIAEVTYILDAQGQRTELTVGPADGYRTKAGKLKTSQKGGGPDWSDVK